MNPIAAKVFSIRGILTEARILFEINFTGAFYSING